MANSWTEHVKKVSAEKGISYKQAMSEAKKTYQTKEKEFKPKRQEEKEKKVKEKKEVKEEVKLEPKKRGRPKKVKIEEPEKKVLKNKNQQEDTIKPIISKTKKESPKTEEYGQ